HMRVRVSIRVVEDSFYFLGGTKTRPTPPTRLHDTPRARGDTRKAPRGTGGTHGRHVEGHTTGKGTGCNRQAASGDGSATTHRWLTGAVLVPVSATPRQARASNEGIQTPGLGIRGPHHAR